MSNGPSLEDDRSWEDEDPNLLNDPNLLFQEAESLPLPAHSHRSDEDFLELLDVVRDLILDNNVAQETIAKKEEIVGSKETANEVIGNLADGLQAANNKCLNAILELKSMGTWDEATKKKIFSDKSGEKVLRWKTALDTFLESFKKIRTFIPKESPVEVEDAHTIENEKIQFKSIPLAVNELTRLLDVFETLSE